MRPVWSLDTQYERPRLRAVQKSNATDAKQDGSQMAARNGNRAMNSQNRFRRSNGTLRAWLATKAEAIDFAENPMNTAYDDIQVLCLKPGCDGWHPSQPHWPDAQAAAKAWVN